MEHVQALTRPSFLYSGSVPYPLDSTVSAIKEVSLPEETVHGVGDSFIGRLHDPVLNRTIEHSYRAISVGDDLAERQ